MPARRPAPVAPAFGGALLLVFAALLRDLRASGAVPPSEFEAAGPLYGSVVPLTVAGILLVAWAAARGPGRPARAAAVAVLAASCAWPPLAAPGAFLLLAVLGAAWLAPARPAGDPDPRLPGWRARRIPALFLALLATAGALAWLVARGEAALFTARFHPRLFDTATWDAHRRSLPALALLLGAEVAAVLTALLALAWGALRLLVARVPGAAARGGRLLGLLVGIALTAALGALARSALADEIDQLGLTAETAALCALLGFGGAALAWDRWRATARRTGPVDDLARWAALLPVWLVVPRRVSSARRTVRWAATGLLLALLAGVTAGLYPEIEDFRMRLFGTLGRIVVYGATWTVLAALTPAARPSAGVRALLAVATAGLLAAAAWGRGPTRRSDVRQVALEYSRFAALATASPLHRLLDDWPRLGDGPPGAAPWTPPPRAARPALAAGAPVIVVVWDAARPDRLSAYGAPRDTTPHLARLAARGVRFTQARTNATATTTAVRALLSGTYTSRFMLAEDHPPLLTRELAAAGYRRFVVTVTGNDHNGVSAESFRRGWDARRAGLEWIDLDYPNVTGAVPDADKTRDVIDVLRGVHARGGAAALDRTFVYLHLTGPHTPWRPPGGGFDFGDAPVDRYDAELARADALLGELRDALADLGVLDRCVLVVCADHGTGLGEHGRIAGFLPYEEQVAIPLVVVAPGLAPRVLGNPVAAIDLAPTLLDLVTGRPRPGAHGRSLRPLMAGEVATLPPRPVVCLEAFDDSYAILDGAARLKLHHHRGRRYEALYDLALDPGERRNLVRERPADAARLRAMLAEFLAAGRGAWAHPWHYRPPVRPR